MPEYPYATCAPWICLWSRFPLFLQNRDPDTIHNLLIKQKEEVSRRRQELLLIERKIDNRLSQIDDALSSRLEEITVSRCPKRRIASIRKQVSPQNYLDLEQSIRQLEQSEETSVTFLGKVGRRDFPGKSDQPPFSSL